MGYKIFSDNLGNHIATQNLDLKNNEIINTRKYNQSITTPTTPPIETCHFYNITDDAPYPPETGRPVRIKLVRKAKFSFYGNTGINAFQNINAISHYADWWNEYNRDNNLVAEILLSNGGWDSFGIFNGCISFNIADWLQNLRRRFYFQPTNILQITGDNGFFGAGSIFDRNFCDTGIVMYDGAIFGLKWIRSFQNEFFFFPPIGSMIGEIRSSTPPAITLMFDTSNYANTKIRVGGTTDTTGGQVLARHFCSPDGTQHIRLLNTDSSLPLPDSINNFTILRGQVVIDNKLITNNIYERNNNSPIIQIVSNEMIIGGSGSSINSVKFGIGVSITYYITGTPTNPNQIQGYIKLNIGNTTAYIPYYT
ncbi:MAG: hypothetical protein NZ839_02875 [Endomicrobia bacterium]|nr:hypothetical protein [Endomicrobiia bacterium]